MNYFNNPDLLNILNSIGIDSLYHITDIENIPSILHNRGISSWTRAIASEIIIPFPGGDAISHRLENRDGMHRSDYVHLYAKKPSTKTIDRYINTGRHTELYTLKISNEIIRSDNAIFYLGEPGDTDFSYTNNINEFAEKIQENPDLLAKVSIDIKEFIPHKYLMELPECHTAKISEIHPTAIIFIIDQSCSMARSTNIDDTEYDYISDLAAEIVNSQIENLLKRCLSKEGDINHLYDIAVIGYGDDVRSAWNGNHSGKVFLSPIELFAHVKGDNDTYKWVEPCDTYRKGRCDLAISYAYDILSEWMSRQDSKYYYPPTVIHITDGEVKREFQNDFLVNAERLKSLRVLDNNVVLWNLGIVSDRRSEKLFPSGEDLPALINPRGALILYEASSYLPIQFKEKAGEIHKGDISLNRRTMGINVLAENITRMLQLCVLPD